MPRIDWNDAGFREVRTSPGVMAELNAHASRIAAACGEGFVAHPPTVTGGRGRGRASVVTATYEAMRRQAKDHVVEQAI